MEALFVSTPTDYFTPLNVDTDIVYTIDEERFPGLNDNQHCREPALKIEYGYQLTGYHVRESSGEASEIPFTTENNLFDLIDSCEDFNIGEPSLRPFGVIPELVTVLQEVENDTCLEISSEYNIQIDEDGNIEAFDTIDLLDSTTFPELSPDIQENNDTNYHNDTEYHNGFLGVTKNGKRQRSESETTVSDVTCEKRLIISANFTFDEETYWVDTCKNSTFAATNAHCSMISVLDSCIPTQLHCNILSDFDCSPTKPLSVRQW